MKIWILQIGEQHKETDGDVKDWRSCRLAKELSAKGHTVTFISSTFNHFTKKQRFSATTKIISPSGYTIVYLKPKWVYRKNISVFRYLQQIEVSKLFKQLSGDLEKPDIVVTSVPTIELSYECAQFCVKSEVPFFVDVRDKWPDIYLTAFPKILQPLASLFFHSSREKLGYVINNSVGVTAVSRSYLDWSLSFQKDFENKIEAVIPIGAEPNTVQADTEFIHKFISKHKINSNDTLITFVGSFGHSYDVLSTINGFSAAEVKSDVKLILIGDGPSYKNCSKSAFNHKNIIITGWLPSFQCMSILKISHFGLACYKSNALQSIPNKIYEYLASGLPIISSLQGEMKTLIEKAGLGFNYDANDPLSFSGIVEQISLRTMNYEKMQKSVSVIFNEQFEASKIDTKFACLISNWKKTKTGLTKVNEF